MMVTARRIMSNSFLSIPRITRFVITKLFLPDQINYVASQRIQRVFQMYSMYHKSSSTSCLIRSMIHTFRSRITIRELKNQSVVDKWWPINRWTTLLIRCRWFQGKRNPIDGKRKFLLSLIPSFSFWDKEGIDDEEIKETIQEFWKIKSKSHHDGKKKKSDSKTRSDSIRYEETRMRKEEESDHSKCDSSPNQNRLGSKNETNLMKEDSTSYKNGREKKDGSKKKERWNEVQGTDLEDQNDQNEEWEPIILKPNYQVWRRFIPNNSSVYQYKSMSILIL